MIKKQNPQRIYPQEAQNNFLVNAQGSTQNPAGKLTSWRRWPEGPYFEL